MNNFVFGEVTFNVGWKTEINITLFGNKHNVIVKAKAYFEKDGITPEQEISYNSFKLEQSEQLKNVEVLLGNYDNFNASTRFIPRMLLFKRDGSYALLLDDNEDAEGGVAVSLAPNAEVLSQDEYL